MILMYNKKPLTIMPKHVMAFVTADGLDFITAEGYKYFIRRQK